MLVRIAFVLLLLVSVSMSQPIANYIVAADFNQPSSMCVDPITGNLWVVDTYNNRLMLFSCDDDLEVCLPFGVLGQPNFTTTTSPVPPHAGSYNLPSDAFIDQFGTLWVADTNNHRVLWYFNASRLTNGSNAAGVLGQQDLTSGSSSPSPSAFSMSYPSSVNVDENGTLWVADQQNNRVLSFISAINQTSGSPADSVLGQSDFSTGHSGCCPYCLNTPGAVNSVSGILVVSDGANNRVLLFTSGNSTVNNGSASWVLMQNTLDFCSSEPPSDSTGSDPAGVAIDGQGNLYVSEYHNNRVLMYQGGAFASSNGLSASYIYGQPDFNSNSSGNATNQLNHPMRVFFDNIRNVLWVADSGNNRVLGFVTFSSVSPNVTLQVSFIGSSPAVVILPTDDNGNIYPLTFQTTFQPLQIEEVDSYNQIIQTLSFPLNGYNADTSINGDGTQFFNFSITTNETTVIFDYALFQIPVMLESAGIQFNGLPNTLKLSLKIYNWTCSSPSNSLKAYFSLTAIPSISSILTQVDPDNPNLDDLVLSSRQMTTTVRMFKYALVDGVRTNITFLYGGDSTLILQFPCFNQSFTYDPDFSVVIAGGTGGGSNDLPLLALLALLIPLVMGTVAGVFVAVRFWRVRFHRSRLNTIHSINLGPDSPGTVGSVAL